HFDIEGAHAFGLPAVGVLYGYGDRAEMEAAGADYIAEDVTGLHDLLVSLLQ
ncbi:MAG: HAD hydrolase-like protein, partial [Rikenellaceae bacterium]|nr:HAD hydrolase-like protein [Rikenellaceae bacterium]